MNELILVTLLFVLCVLVTIKAYRDARVLDKEEGPKYDHIDFKVYQKRPDSQDYDMNIWRIH